MILIDLHMLSLYYHYVIYVFYFLIPDYSDNLFVWQCRGQVGVGWILYDLANDHCLVDSGMEYVRTTLTKIHHKAPMNI